MQIINTAFKKNTDLCSELIALSNDFSSSKCWKYLQIDDILARYLYSETRETDIYGNVYPSLHFQGNDALT